MTIQGGRGLVEKDNNKIYESLQVDTTVDYKCINKYCINYYQNKKLFYKAVAVHNV